MLSEASAIRLQQVYEANIHETPRLSDMCEIIRAQEYYSDMFIRKYTVRELWMMDANRVKSIKESLQNSLMAYDYDLMIKEGYAY